MLLSLLRLSASGKHLEAEWEIVLNVNDLIEKRVLTGNLHFRTLNKKLEH